MGIRPIGVKAAPMPVTSALLGMSCSGTLDRERQKVPPMTSRAPSKPTVASGRWPLQDAKARLSEVVREAQTNGPQRVTVHGEDAAVIVSAAEFDRAAPPVSGRDIVAALAASPLRDVPFEREPSRDPVRDTPL